MLGIITLDLISCNTSVPEPTSAFGLSAKRTKAPRYDDVNDPTSLSDLQVSVSPFNPETNQVTHILRT
ncbi:predicted protein [Lichtheimia corymbifera JMRC:FSU:9682]|uniref:Uncharacterized protein n=1 Tax=Lichtheimia corymbifera JMRC:FSU:9682 TaxID=1263082 RepID=A0A068RQQ3_9FUNG|nr:predicted protein [Lichtheimia corymbifera JMRC:FSU:9682]